MTFILTVMGKRFTCLGQFPIALMDVPQLGSEMGIVTGPVMSRLATLTMETARETKPPDLNHPVSLFCWSFSSFHLFLTWFFIYFFISLFLFFYYERWRRDNENRDPDEVLCQWLP